MTQESLEETQQRLARGMTAPAAATNSAASAVPEVGQRGSGSGTLRGLVALGVVLALGGAGFAVSAALTQAGVVDDKWTSYPGSAFVPSEEVLAGESLEEVQARSEAVTAELQAELADYGFEWSLEFEGDTSRGINGYGGDSMLYNYMSGYLVGSAQVQDPEARERITDIFAEVMAQYPDTEISLFNEFIVDSDAVSQFGSADPDQQAVWHIRSSENGWVGLAMSLSVYDTGVPTESGFSTPFWMPLESTATLFVSITGFAPHVLSERDRDAFIEALTPYEGETKPPFRE